MHGLGKSIGINGKWNTKGQPANTGSPEKMPVVLCCEAYEEFEPREDAQSGKFYRNKWRRKTGGGGNRLIVSK